MSVLAISAAVLWATGGCRGDRRDATTPVHPGDGARGSHVAGAGGSADTPDMAASEPLTEAECATLVAHVVAVGLRAHNQAEEAAYRPSAEQVAQIEAQLRAELLPACLRLERAAWQCAMAAETGAELAACEAAP
jgi:hypothetical protein